MSLTVVPTRVTTPAFVRLAVHTSCCALTGCEQDKAAHEELVQVDTTTLPGAAQTLLTVQAEGGAQLETEQAYGAAVVVAVGGETQTLPAAHVDGGGHVKMEHTNGGTTHASADVEPAGDVSPTGHAVHSVAPLAEKVSGGQKRHWPGSSSDPVVPAA